MVIESRPMYSRNLTGQKQVRVGLFGLLIGYVQVKVLPGDVVWLRVKTQEEWDWCDQFEQHGESKFNE